MSKKAKDHLQKVLEEISNIDDKNNASVLTGLHSIRQEVNSALSAISRQGFDIDKISKSLSSKKEQLSLEISNLEDYVAENPPISQIPIQQSIHKLIQMDITW